MVSFNQRFASASAEYDVKEDAACEDTDSIDFDDKEKDDETPAAAAETKGSTPPTKDPQLPKGIFQPDMYLYRKKVSLDPSSKWTLDRDKFIKDFGENWEDLTRNQKIAFTHVLLFLMKEQVILNHVRADMGNGIIFCPNHSAVLIMTKYDMARMW